MTTTSNVPAYGRFGGFGGRYVPEALIPAREFGWILPLPSVPKLELGSDELFVQLTNTTQPKYKLNRVYEGDCGFDPSRNRFGRFSRKR